jgi:hypothetical protein
VLQSKYNFCLSLSRPLLLQFEYNFCLSPSRILLPQSECTFCLNPSRPYILPRERERERVVSCSLEAFWSCYSILKFPWKKIIKKKLQQKKRKKAKRTKKATTKKGLCVCFPFFCVVVLCDYLCVQALCASSPHVPKLEQYPSCEGTVVACAHHHPSDLPW